MSLRRSTTLTLWAPLAMAAGAALACSIAACGSSSASSAPSTDASVTSQGYGASACGTCVLQACATQVQACTADPQCADYLSCLKACPVDSAGNIVASCLSACPLPNESTGQSAQAALAACRTQGAGASCASCGGSVDAGEAGAPEAATPGGDASPNDAAASDGGVNACFRADASACQACEELDCCGQEHACLDSPVCVSFFNCREACTQTPGPGGLDACWYGCDQQYANGVQTYATFATCLEVSCSAPSLCDDTCNYCATSSCGQEYSQCFGNGDCYAYFDCILSCSGADAGGCQVACANAYPSAVTPLDDFETCFGNKCPNTCKIEAVRPHRTNLAR